MSKHARPSQQTPVWVAVVGIGAMVAAIFVVLNPTLLFTASTPTGGDMGAHVAVPAYLRDVMLPSGRILGFSDAWFAGFPFLYFYFPLTSLVTVLADVALPYGMAFKLVSIMGLLALAPATFFLVRAMGASRFSATVAGAAGGAFVFMESFSIYGGNIPSTLAGEFSFSWSFALMMVYLGLLIQIVRDGKRRIPLAGLVLGLTALTHLITTLMAILASIPVLFWKRGFRAVATVWALGFGVAAFWTVPLLTRISSSSDMAWTPLHGWSNVLPTDLRWLIVPAVVGVVVLVARHGHRVAPLLTLTATPVLYYWAIASMPDWLPDGLHHIQDKLWNGRFLPFFYFGVWVLAGVAIAWILRLLAERMPLQVDAVWVRVLIIAGAVLLFVTVDQIGVDRPGGWVTAGVATVAVLFVSSKQARTASVLPLVGVVLMLAMALSPMSYIPGWVRWNFTGYEGKDTAAEYFGLMDTLNSLPPGRVQWEYSADQNKYGTPMSLMLIPYWTSWKDPSMEGLFFESSLTTTFHFLNQAETSVAPSSPIPGLRYQPFDLQRGIEHLQLYGVRYYVTYTPEAAEMAAETPGLTLVGESDPFKVFELPPSPLVQIADFVPVVYAGDDFSAAALDWYEGDLDPWLVADGPSFWPRVGDGAPLPAVPASGSGTVSAVSVSNDLITFHTTAVGVPHLIKVSYFPDWRAVGAAGPYRVAPSLMLVIPTSADVTLVFGPSPLEQAGSALSILTLAGIGVAALSRRKSKVAE